MSEPTSGRWIVERLVSGIWQLVAADADAQRAESRYLQLAASDPRSELRLIWEARHRWPGDPVTLVVNREQP